MSLKNKEKKNDRDVDYSVYKIEPKKKYGVLFFETFKLAHEQKILILENCKDVDQLNVVIKAEGDMDDREILNIHPKVKLFAGAAWALLHERRVEDGWYNTPQ